MAWWTTPTVKLPCFMSLAEHSSISNLRRYRMFFMALLGAIGSSEDCDYGVGGLPASSRLLTRQGVDFSETDRNKVRGRRPTDDE